MTDTCLLFHFHRLLPPPLTTPITHLQRQCDDDDCQEDGAVVDALEDVDLIIDAASIHLIGHLQQPGKAGSTKTHTPSHSLPCQHHQVVV